MTEATPPSCWCGLPCERNGAGWRKDCAAHRQRRKRKRAVDGEIKEYAKDPIDGLGLSAIRLAETEDKPARLAGKDAWRLAKEAARASLRRYLWHYVPKLLRRQNFTPATRAEIEKFLATYKKRR